MDPGSNEQTELLRNIWNQMKELDRNLGARIDGVKQEVTGVKQEVSDLKQEVAGLRVELKQDITDLRVELKQEIGDLRTELKEEIVELRRDVVDLKLEVKAVRVATQGTFELLGRDHTDLRQRVDKIEDHLGLRPPKRKH